MAHHRRYQLDRAATESCVFQLQSRPMNNAQKVDEDEAAEVDEPPDHLSLDRLLKSPPLKVEKQATTTHPESLLTKALLTSPNLRGVSAVDTSMRRAQSTTSNHSVVSSISTADLTSDGGLTSPARTTTPSPPLPFLLTTGLPLFTPKGLDEMDNTHADAIRLPHAAAAPASKPAPPKRHITFACSRPQQEKAVEEEKNKKEEPAPRKCMLRFACPTKPREEPAASQVPKHKRSPSPAAIDTAAANLQTPPGHRRHRDSESTIKDEHETPKAKSSKAKRSEALRFHEFAAGKPEEEEWTMQQPANRQKITVSDTLRKENAIRKLGEEAEEEALMEEEEEDDDVDMDEDDDDMDDDLDDEDSDEDSQSDGGNETDDEEGFAASDDESDVDSEYQFWTPAVTTAATSTEHLEHIRPKTRRTASESSIESIVNTAAMPMERMNPKTKSRRRGSPKMRPGTPELPDSTDFVCGTLDEDRPLEQAYLSCMEQRRIAKHGLLPQDVDPSFPTSDPEDEEDDDDEDEIEEASDGHAWIAGKPDESDDGLRHQRSRANSHRNGRAKSPAPSPKRVRSPAPKRRNKSPAPVPSHRGHAARSPPPRRLFGQSPRRDRSPPSRTLKSPPGSLTRTRGVDFPSQLAQRPQLTHTKSLPRTPNPYWTEHRRSQLEARRLADEGEETATDDVHNRGPIDIVQGLERKRQRRKEKFWKQHCRHAANNKDKERRCQPGKGAQRMREVGLEMSERCKGYGQRLQLVGQLVLSV